LQALRPVVEPESGMSVVDMGMIRAIAIAGDAVEVKMDLTAPFCPLSGMITEQVRQAAAQVPGVKEAKVTLLDEPWDPSWMKRSSQRAGAAGRGDAGLTLKTTIRSERQ
jgi:metal-sulfur cluster biosynthetic enzyme